MAARRSFLFCSLLLLLALFVAPAQADEALPGKPEGTVASCFDGDTFKLSDRRVVRLAGIDTPELNKRDHKPQYYAREAAAILGAMTRGQKVQLRAAGKEARDRYGRLVAEVILPGGKLNRFSLSASGSRSIRAVSELTFDTLFLGTTRYSADTGFTCESDEEADLKKTCMARASKVVMLMDSSKVDKRGTFRICGLEDIDVLVSDGELPRDMLLRCADNNVEVL